MEVPSEDELDGVILEEDEEEGLEEVEEVEETDELTQDGKDDDNQHPTDNGNDQDST